MSISTLTRIIAKLEDEIKDWENHVVLLETRLSEAERRARELETEVQSLRDGASSKQVQVNSSVTKIVPEKGHVQALKRPGREPESLATSSTDNSPSATITSSQQYKFSKKDEDILKSLDIRTGRGRPVAALNSGLPHELLEQLTMTVEQAKNTARRRELWLASARGTACLTSRGKDEKHSVAEDTVGKVCTVCEKAERLCIQKTRDGRPTLVPLRKDVRKGSIADESFWIREWT